MQSNDPRVPAPVCSYPSWSQSTPLDSRALNHLLTRNSSTLLKGNLQTAFTGLPVSESLNLGNKGTFSKRFKNVTLWQGNKQTGLTLKKKKKMSTRASLTWPKCCGCVIPPTGKLFSSWDRKEQFYFSIPTNIKGNLVELNSFGRINEYAKHTDWIDQVCLCIISLAILKY